RAQLSLTVREAQHVRVDVYDAAGRRVATLLDETVEANRVRALVLEATGLSSGMYVVRAVGEQFVGSVVVTVAK
ncbi:MAG TPA: lysyl endopeptidase, partial [Rhodothermales bacterium]|nr:lysyl endopeptidase [Rhodothermales bacterium]